MRIRIGKGKGAARAGMAECLFAGAHVARGVILIQHEAQAESRFQFQNGIVAAGGLLGAPVYFTG